MFDIKVNLESEFISLLKLNAFFVYQIEKDHPTAALAILGKKIN